MIGFQRKVPISTGLSEWRENSYSSKISLFQLRSYLLNLGVSHRKKEIALCPCAKRQLVMIET